MRMVLDSDEREVLDHAWAILNELAKRDNNKTAETAATMVARIINEDGEKSG